MNTRSPDAMRQEKLSGFLKIEASKLGFDICRITRPDSIPLAADRLAHFVDAGYPGTMDWMAETIERRSNPSVLWPEVRSIVMLGMNYASGDDPLQTLQKPDRGNISVYARNRDYHDVIKGKLKELAAKFAALSKAEVKVFVDTAPVMEKPLAEAAGIGWQGKHTNLVSREFGSWLFLGSIFTVAPLAYDEAEKDHCGSCRACLDACPIEAFPAPYQIDARRCISYLTIEHKGSIPVEFRDKIGNRIYGCDDCLAACPWNKFAARSHEIKLLARPEMLEPKLADLLTLDDEAFRTFFSGSPVKRIGRNRFVRNCLIAAGNSGDHQLIAPVQLLLADPDPYVRAMAIWALSRLLPPDDLRTVAASWAGETDPVVQEELERLRGAGCI